MGRETILVIYEDKKLGQGQVDVDQIVSALETLQKKKKFDIKSYSFQEVADKDTVKFSKALIICHDGSRFPGKITDITSRFDEEDAGEFRVLIPGLATVQTESSISGNHLMAVDQIEDISTWWPKVLHFLFPRAHREGKVLSCLILFDGNSAVQNLEEYQWLHKMKKTLEPIGITCLWFLDIENGIVTLDGENAPGMVRPDVILVLSRQGGGMMFLQNFAFFRQKIKTVVLTDDANSDVCRKLDKAIEKIYIYPTENPMEMSLIGWAALLKELKIIKCEDTVFKEVRRRKKIMLVVLTLVLLFIVLPLVLALIAAVIILCLCGVDVGKLCDLCCCTCPGMVECMSNLPCCWICCITVFPNESGAVFSMDDHQSSDMVQETV